MDKSDELLARLDALHTLASAEIPGTEEAVLSAVMEVYREACDMIGQNIKEIFND